MKPHLLDTWQIRMDGHVMFSVHADDDLALAAQILRRFRLSEGAQVRLQLDQETLKPTGIGWICHPDGVMHKRFQLLQAGPRRVAA